MVTEMELLVSPDLTPLDFFCGGWMKGEVNKRNVDTRGETLDRIMDAAADRIKKCEDQLRRAKCGLCTRVAKYIEVGGGIFEHLL